MLGRRPGCTTHPDCTKIHARPVGGRGISAFQASLFLAASIFCWVVVIVLTDSDLVGIVTTIKEMERREQCRAVS